MLDYFSISLTKIKKTSSLRLAFMKLYFMAAKETATLCICPKRKGKNRKISMGKDRKEKEQIIRRRKAQSIRK